MLCRIPEPGTLEDFRVRCQTANLLRPGTGKTGQAHQVEYSEIEVEI